MAKGAVDRALSDFEKSLRRFGKKLIRRANGRICGTCRFHIRGLCIENDIDILTVEAVACDRHEEKESWQTEPYRRARSR